MVSPEELVYGRVSELGVRPEPFRLYDKPLVPCPQAPLLRWSHSAISLKSPHLVSRASFCPRLTWHTL